MKNKYYVLENKNILAEEDYIKLRASEYLQNNEGYKTLNDYLEDATDFSLIDIIEINEDDFRNCDTLNDMIYTAFGASQLFEEESEKFKFDYESYLECESFSLYIDGYNYLNIEFEILDEETDKGNTKIKYTGYDFI